MSKIHYGVFELGGAYPTGETIEAHWTVDDDGTVTLTDADGNAVRNSWGNPVRERVTNGQLISPVVLASRLATRHHQATNNADGMSSFRRSINPREYPKTPC